MPVPKGLVVLRYSVQGAVLRSSRGERLELHFKLQTNFVAVSSSNNCASSGLISILSEDPVELNVIEIFA